MRARSAWLPPFRASPLIYWFCAVLSVGLSAASVVAQDSCLELAAELPGDLQSCVSAERLCASYQAALAAHSGTRPLTGVSRVQLVAADGDGVKSLDLEAFSAARSLGHRTLAVRARDCAALPDALALVLVLLAEEAGAAVPDVPAPEPAPALPPVAAEAAVVAQPSAAKILALGAGAGVAFGTLPSAAFGFQLQASTLTEPVAFRARALLLWPQELAVAEGFVLMQDYELALEACPGAQVSARPRVALRLCAGPRFGLFLARARDFNVQNDRALEFLLSLGVTPEVSLALGEATWLQLSAGAVISLARPRVGVVFDDGMRWLELSALHWLRAEVALSLVQIF